MADDGTDGDAPDDPFDGFGMFGMPMFGDLSKMLAGQGSAQLGGGAPVRGPVVRLGRSRRPSLAAAMMGGSTHLRSPRSSANIDPSVRIKYDELAGDRPPSREPT